MTTRPKLENIFAVLSDEHSIKLFKQASTTFEGGRDAPGKMGLTKKQFYARLHRLVKAGLVERSGSLYKQTALGSMVNDLQVKPLEDALTEYWRLLAINEIKKSGLLPRKEQESIAQSILNEGKMKQYLDQNKAQPPKIIYTYEELVDRVLRLIGSAKKEIFLASRYYDPKVSLLLMKKFEEGVSLNLLDDNPSGTTLISRLNVAMSDPSTQSTAKAILESPKVRIQSHALEYSFLVVDGAHCQVEIVDGAKPGEFNFAVEVNDHQICRKMIAVFEKTMLSVRNIKDSHPEIERPVASLEKPRPT
jgi:predicted transcriptional regulator